MERKAADLVTARTGLENVSTAALADQLEQFGLQRPQAESALMIESAKRMRIGTPQPVDAGDLAVAQSAPPPNRVDPGAG